MEKQSRKRVSYLLRLAAISSFIFLLALLTRLSPLAASWVHAAPLQQNAVQAYALQASTPEPEPTKEPTPTPPPFPLNHRTLHKTKTEVFHHWMLVRLGDDPITCHIYMPTLNKPGDRDVLGYCGYSVYQQWLEKQACEASGGPCESLNLHYIDPIDEELKVSIKMPGPLGFVETVNCPPWGICNEYPRLRFGAYEPLASEFIESVHIKFEDGQEVDCDFNPCEVEIPQTPNEGLEVSFYTDSTFGDKSVTQSFLVRNIALFEGGYIFQVLGDSWWGQIPAETAYWEFFPPLETENISWAAAVSSPEELATSHDYALLAGKLILRGAVSAAGCEDGGLLPNGAASACGIDAARIQTTMTQNNFDAYLLEAAKLSRIPPKILKGVIGQESQFWHSWVIEGEYGYGMMTDKGVDMLLNYDTRFFLDLCTPVYGASDCSWGYSSLGEFPQAYLRGLALSMVGTEREFELIGRTIAAATGQTGQIIRNITRDEPGELLSYKELWLISLAIYHGGGGCVGVAAEEAYAAEVPLTWANISEYLQGDCQLVATYPYLVLRYAE